MNGKKIVGWLLRDGIAAKVFSPWGPHSVEISASGRLATESAWWTTGSDVNHMQK